MMWATVAPGIEVEEAKLEAGYRYCSVCAALVGQWRRAVFVQYSTCGVGKNVYRCRVHSEKWA